MRALFVLLPFLAACASADLAGTYEGVQAAAGAGTTVYGDTTAYVDDLHPASTCTGYEPDGPDAVYTVTAAVGQTITATVAPEAWDISLYVTSDCVLVPACLSGADVGFEGDPETLSFAVPATGPAPARSPDLSASGAADCVRLGLASAPPEALEQALRTLASLARDTTPQGITALPS